MDEMVKLMQKLADEIVKLRKDLSELQIEHSLLKTFVKQNYKQDHPGTVFCDELEKKHEITIN